MPGPAGVCQRRSPGGVPRVPMPSGGCGAGSRGAGGAGAALRSWGALTLPRGASRGLGGVPGTGRPHSLPGPIPCGVSGAMAPAPCSSAPEVSLLSAFPPLCVPRGAAPTQSCPWWTPGLGLGPAVGLGGDRGTRLLCWGCLHSKRMRGAAGRAAFPPSEQGWVPLAGSTARAVPHSCSGNGVQPRGGAAAPSPSLCTTAPRAALGWGQRLDVQPRTDAGCGMRTQLGLGSPSRPHRIWVSSPCEDGPLLAPGGWTRAGASPLPAPRCFSLVQQELSQSDGPAVQAAR